MKSNLTHDLTSGLVVFLVALPLCLGVALASNAPMFAGVLAGIIGGIVVGIMSGSHTSVSGPSPGSAAVVAAQIAMLGSFEAFLMALVVAGLMQIVLGLIRGGTIAAYFPSSVINGLLGAIGVIIVLKQVPHLFGRDLDPEGDMAFFQPDRENTFSEIYGLIGGIHLGATVVALTSLAVLILWEWYKPLKRSFLPAPLVVVALGVAMAAWFRQLGSPWAIEAPHLVQVPVASTFRGLSAFLQTPDFSAWLNPKVYLAGATLAAVTSLETLLNLEAIDKLDPKQRNSPPNRELLGQGIGNVASGLLGGMPITSVIVRSSLNINSGGQTKLATIFHGCLLLASVVLLPAWLNMIPLSCLAAILMITGAKLASPALVKRMWSEGYYQFVPFILTVTAIVLTDLLVGVMIGMAISIGFILRSNFRRPLRQFVEKQLGGEVLHLQLASQVSFLNRAAIEKALDSAPRGGHVLLDAQLTDYIDPDVLNLIRTFEEKTAKARGVKVSLLGFRKKYHLKDRTRYVDYSTPEIQKSLTPKQVLQILKDGNERFRTGHRLTRNLSRQVHATAEGQAPLAVVLTCIDSRSPAELVFDLGVGDIFSVRIAGNVTSPKVLGSMEYSCAVAGAKLLLVMGHTRCGAVGAAVSLLGSGRPVAEATGCEHLEPIVLEIQQSVHVHTLVASGEIDSREREKLVNLVARDNVLRAVRTIREESGTLARLADDGRIAILGAMYDVVTGTIEFLNDFPSQGQGDTAGADATRDAMT